MDPKISEASREPYWEELDLGMKVERLGRILEDIYHTVQKDFNPLLNHDHKGGKMVVPLNSLGHGIGIMAGRGRTPLMRRSSEISNEKTRS